MAFLKWPNYRAPNTVTAETLPVHLTKDALGIEDALLYCCAQRKERRRLLTHLPCPFLLTVGCSNTVRLPCHVRQSNRTVGFPWLSRSATTVRAYWANHATDAASLDNKKSDCPAVQAADFG
jgi:hypothetical protein